MTDNDFETAPLGTIKALDDKDMEIQRLKAALNEIVDFGSDIVAVTIAEEALRLASEGGGND